MSQQPQPAWIFLRGLMRDRRHWGGFPQDFTQQLPDAQVITLDLPGNGALNHLPSPARVEAMAEWCRAELRGRGLPPPYRVLANSLGAMVTVAWAAAHPQELDRVVLVNTSLRPYSRFWQRMRPAAWPTLLRLALTRPAPRRTETAILDLISHHPQRNAVLLDQWSAWREALPVSRANALRQLIAAARFRAPAAPLRVPTLLLVGARDRLVDPRCTHRLAQAWGCEVAEHPAAGHDLPLDDGPWVAAQVQRWLASA
ncbi:MAG TPA: alpha/beta hydrolase [Solimonas sp.]